MNNERVVSRLLLKAAQVASDLALVCGRSAVPVVEFGAQPQRAEVGSKRHVAGWLVLA